jgi:hypothetical protein
MEALKTQKINKIFLAILIHMQGISRGGHHQDLLTQVKRNEGNNLFIIKNV